MVRGRRGRQEALTDDDIARARAHQDRIYLVSKVFALGSYPCPPPPSTFPSAPGIADPRPRSHDADVIWRPPGAPHFSHICRATRGNGKRRGRGDPRRAHLSCRGCNWPARPLRERALCANLKSPSLNRNEGKQRGQGRGEGDRLI